MGRPQQAVAEKFIPKVDTSGECWMWTASVNRQGYGNFTSNGKHLKAHRVAWELANSMKIPDDLVVMHTCDTPGCCRPTHLKLGTRKENNEDMAAKGRHGQGKKTHCPKGHEYTSQNTYIIPTTGGRSCRKCGSYRQLTKAG